MDKSNTAATPARRPRADARRNVDAVLEAAAEVFATSGVDAPVREVANKAGVGTATLYRHFPTRADLIQAVFRREVDTCVEAARQLASTHPPREALEQWLFRFMGFISTKRGLAPALQSGDATYESLPGYFLGSLGPALQDLLDAAAAAGVIATDIGATDLLLAVSRLCTPGPTDDDPRRLAQMFIPVLLRGMSA
ncbi:TetR/AcrR family transcriptional regulator [uncultured Microbacterium sp.]|uniref:TetR/AcrR family transcriptional regulator n=1 Tax=uncultured Microbacterium sp. TaxID=191216 RepID=UPI00374783C5